MMPPLLLSILLFFTTSSLAVPFKPVNRRASCPANFRNVVFNTVAPRSAGWPGTIWDSLSSNGVSNWIGFTQDPIPNTPIYNLPSGQAAPATPGLDAAQIPISMDPRDVNGTMTMLQSASPPSYMELFNEPDFSYMGFTPLTSPQDAATALAPLWAINTSTQLISPALAFTSSDWLSQFDSACGNCIDAHMNIVSAHLYDPNPDNIMSSLDTLHNTWPSKKIWITELAPASSSDQGCSLDTQGVIDWMNNVIPRIAATGYVDRVFWNCGEWGPLQPANDPNVCNPSLTNEDGSPTAILQAYGAVCG